MVQADIQQLPWLTADRFLGNRLIQFLAKLHEKIYTCPISMKQADGYLRKICPPVLIYTLYILLYSIYLGLWQIHTLPDSDWWIMAQVFIFSIVINIPYDLQYSVCVDGAVTVSCRSVWSCLIGVIWCIIDVTWSLWLIMNLQLVIALHFNTWDKLPLNGFSARHFWQIWHHASGYGLSLTYLDHVKTQFLLPWWMCSLT